MLTAQAPPAARLALSGLLVVAAFGASGGSGGCSRGAQPCDAAPGPAEPEVSPGLHRFLTTYFSSWSEGDMNGYRDHFHDEAVILFVNDGRIREPLPLGPFIEEQARMQRDPERRAVERMTAVRANEDDVAATAVVDWVLERGETRQRGVDRFTLIREPDGHWVITTLVFYVTDRGSPAP